jgi:hypothetical protein
MNFALTQLCPGPYGFVVLNTSSGIGPRLYVPVASSNTPFFSCVHDERLQLIMLSYGSEVGYLQSSFQPMNGNS